MAGVVAAMKKNSRRAFRARHDKMLKDEDEYAGKLAAKRERKATARLAKLQGIKLSPSVRIGKANTAAGMARAKARAKALRVKAGAMDEDSDDGWEEEKEGEGGDGDEDMEGTKALAPVRHKKLNRLEAKRLRKMRRMAIQREEAQRDLILDN